MVAGIHLGRLQDLLSQGNWQEANQETLIVMLRAIGKSENEWLTDKDLMNLPCADLLAIDQLWQHHSQGHFGFTTQTQIYQECGAKLNGNYPGHRIWGEFGTQIGWRTLSTPMSSSTEQGWIAFSKATFSLAAPRGHLPWFNDGWIRYQYAKNGILFMAVDSGDWDGVVWVLYSRLQHCQGN